MKKKTEETQTKRSDFALFIQFYRFMHKLSQVDLADKMKTSKTAVALAETDKFDFPIAFFRQLLPLLNEQEKDKVYEMFNEAVKRELNKK